MNCLRLITLAFIVAFVTANTRGCGKRHKEGFNSNKDNHKLQSGGRTRTYAVNVPEGYNNDLNKEWPLIIDFHGNGGSPEKQYENSRYYKYNQGQKYIVVYPAGVEKHWQGPSYAVKGVNDLAFVTDLLEHIRDNYCIDNNRLYASGKSIGGGFVDILACSPEGNPFSAFAMAAPALYAEANPQFKCPYKRAILQAHGTNDQTIPYKGSSSGKGGPIPSILEWVSRWGKRNGCSNQDMKTLIRECDGYKLFTYSCNGYDKIVQHYQVINNGHCWPSTSRATTDGRRDYCGPYLFDYTPRVLEFFSRWNKKNAPST
ncbi:bifunctional acetylxylan esterase/xylanase [Acrasis kona]|uniref:Bifunctional acetylxylan esterase/xylanase n=1 Tax=Acrasis kona TaxID=1008807 RepID=A0AAW2Z2Y1_9EUKA